MKKEFTLITALLTFSLILSAHTTVFSQKGDKTSLDKKNRTETKTGSKTVVKKPEVKPPPVIVKKVEPPPRKIIVQPLPKKVRAAAVKPKRNGRFIKVLFTTPENGLEVEVDKKSFYVNKEAEVEISLTAGKHLIYVRRNGQPITDLLELTVSANQDDIDLSPYIKDFSSEVAEKVTADEVVQAGEVVQPNVPAKDKTSETTENQFLPQDKAVNNSVGLNMVTQNIESVIKRFQDPKDTSSVTLNEWDYIYRQTLQNELLPRYTKDQINLMNKFAEGQVNLLQNNYLQAINSFSGAVTTSLILKDKLRNNSPLPYYGLGLAYYANKNYDDAIKSFLSAVRIDNKFALGYSRLGDSYKAAGRGKEALSYYLSAHKNGDNSFEFTLNLANSLKTYESYTEAVNLYLELVKKKPSAEMYLNMGDCYVELKKNVSAMDSYRESIKLDPNSALGYLRLGNMYVELKDPNLAVESWQKSLDLDKDGKLINRKKVQEMIKKAKKKV
jgi:tetratricopeptide (TPR) repeat protein